MPYLTKSDIEAIGQRVIAAYSRLPTVRAEQANKVHPELLVNDLLGLFTGYHILSRTGQVLGLTSCGEIGVPIYDDPEHPNYFFLDGKTLLIDKSLISEGANTGRYHFTLVHEACHQIYKMLFPKEYTNSVTKRQVHYCMQSPAPNSDYWEEWRTNALASAILMPVDMILHNMDDFGLGRELRMLNRVFAPTGYKQFEQMADYMGVSKQALSIRLEHLGLLKLNYLQDPYALVDIYPEEGC